MRSKGKQVRQDTGGKADQGRANEVARKQGATTIPYFISDCWGGYWQCVTKYGPYNFRLEKRAGAKKSARKRRLTAHETAILRQIMQ
jgi:hypothetical protein